MEERKPMTIRLLEQELYSLCCRRKHLDHQIRTEPQRQESIKVTAMMRAVHGTLKARRDGIAPYLRKKASAC